MHGFNKEKDSAHSQITEAVGEKNKVLEFGCGKGFVSEQMQKKFNQITAVEIDPASAKNAEKFCNRIIVGDIEEIDFSKLGKEFDVAVFGDVLEHLKKPEKTLQKTRKLLKKRGGIVVSVPNIANWKIRMKLLTGKFDYTDNGILDKTHLRFFTLKNIKKIIEENGFEIEKVSSVPSAPVPTKALKKAMAKIFPGVFSFQFIIIAKVKQ
jgi:O-antigen biosynthesis protein